MSVAEAFSPPPNRIGKYEILSVLGKGGMATVHRAQFRGPADATKEVALKVIHPHLCEEHNFLLMFLNEMKVAMSLSHRNIVQTFDAGNFKNTYYLVMELVHGGSLSSLLRHLPKDICLPIDVALFIGMEICSALDYAHRFRPGSVDNSPGVIHRDISPGNILLSYHGDVKLTDFGIAKAANQLSSVFSSKLVFGKLSYMAPEQAHGNVEPRSDLFSLGAILYEVLYRIPFRNHPTLQDLTNRLPPLPFPSPRPSNISKKLEMLLRQCLNPAPTFRPANANEFHQLLADELYYVQQINGKRLDPRLRLGELVVKYLKDQKPLLSPSPREARLMEALEKAILDVPNRPKTEETPPAQTQWTVPLPSDQKQSNKPIIIPQNSLPDLHSIAKDDSLPAIRQRPWSIIMIAAGIAGILLLLTLGLWHFNAINSTPTDTFQPISEKRDISAADRSITQSHSNERIDSQVFRKKSHILLPTIDSRTKNDILSPLRPSSLRTKSRSANRPVKKNIRWGRLDLNSEPWAEAYIDGSYRGETPLQNLDLTAGFHHVRLVNLKLNLRIQFTINVRPGHRLVKVVRLKPVSNP